MSIATNSAKPPKASKRSKKARHLYDQYLADSGSDTASVGSSREYDTSTVDCEEFTVGMNINILIQQTVQNLIQSVCLEDYDGLSRFGDYELTCFAAAVKHNSSILSLQIRYLDVSDVSLVPLCEALQEHPSLRALDLSGTRGGEATSKALESLVCKNSCIIFARIEDTIVSGKSDIIQTAVRFNAMVCADPTSNPFQLGLLRKISAMEEEEHSFNQQLQAKPWLFGDSGGASTTEQSTHKKTKKVTIVSPSTARIGGEVCAAFVQGRCPYGSRCKFLHPERTSAMRNAAVLAQQEQINECSSSYSMSTTVTARRRLQSRLRPTQFTFLSAGEGGATTSEDCSPCDSADDDNNGLSVASVWTLSATLTICCAVLILSL